MPSASQWCRPPSLPLPFPHSILDLRNTPSSWALSFLDTLVELGPMVNKGLREILTFPQGTHSAGLSYMLAPSGQGLAQIGPLREHEVNE